MSSPREHLKEISALVRTWPPYMQVQSSEYKKWKASAKSEKKA